MMAKKMAGFFSIIGVIVFLGNWLYFCLLPRDFDREPMTAETAWEVGIYLSAAFFLLGLFVSTLGIALVQEALAENRSRDIEKKFRAKSAYDLAMAETMKTAGQSKS
ncbi:MAG: hypothetical protein LBU23_08380 [Planctomycetota bacterium]|jgi:hypothetical protein|nr:hypothetical protein [Planctomycetota bacterium]MDR1520141.1 hypothetical protein [Planctomycetota bacterium]